VIALVYPSAVHGVRQRIAALARQMKMRWRGYSGHTVEVRIALALL
jgi:hypothetical protein